MLVGFCDVCGWRGGVAGLSDRTGTGGPAAGEEPSGKEWPGIAAARPVVVKVGLVVADHRAAARSTATRIAELAEVLVGRGRAAARRARLLGGDRIRARAAGAAAPPP